MADEESFEEEAALELQLEEQLDEQKTSLDAVNEALDSDPSNSELLAVHEELVSAIKDAEEGLLHLKRSRLLNQIDSIFPTEASPSQCQSTRDESLNPSQIEAEQLQPEPIFPVGSKCRFKHTDGRWYNGCVVSLEGNNTARVTFLNPTSENMMICKFFLQQRCRFGGNCRLSHGFIISISSLKQYIPTVWHNSLVGSTILATTEPNSIWKKAELETYNEELNLAQVIFLETGTSFKLGTDSLSLSQYAPTTSESESEELSEQEEELSSSSDLEEEGEEEEISTFQQGLGFMEAKLQKGVQTETSVFAKWENHTRGIASKMMANMGYKEGMGLGISGQGILNPIPVKVLPGKQSLDHAVNANESTKDRDKGKKRSRGGKRKRDKKYANLVKQRKAQEETKPDVFTFINHQLGPNGNNNNSGGKVQKEEKREENRNSMVKCEDEVKELRVRVGKLEEMVKRNKKDKAVCEAANRKLSEVKRELESAELAHESVSNEVFRKEKMKKWLKF
ncbi:hypothetical protein LUZ60_000796 [Juncus effusus]|nr:hypothetical protein LUZ60_000796 [Juncus effusus]